MAGDPAMYKSLLTRALTSARRDPVIWDSIFEIFPAGCAAWVAGKEAKDKDAEKEKDDGINRNLEGKHGNRPASEI